MTEGGQMLGQGGGVLGVLSLIVTYLLHRDGRQSKDAHATELETVKTNHATELGVVKADLVRNEASLKAAWDKIDDLRENIVRKDDLKEYRNEIKQDMKELGTRLEKSFEEAVLALRRELKNGGG